MKTNSGVFVKLNYKNVGEMRSLIVDRENLADSEEKYLMCAGKYDKNGWSFVFKAKNISEAEELISRAPGKIIEKPEYKINTIHMIEQEVVQIPSWI